MKIKNEPYKRELNIIKFAHEMRFITSKQTQMAFYLTKRNGQRSTSDNYAKRALSSLVQKGLLKSHQPNPNHISLYSPTERGRNILYQAGILETRPSPSEIRNLYIVHDGLVTDVRIALERAGAAKEWVPETEIRKMFGMFSGVEERFIPDGMFINRLGELTAVEVEVSRKGLKQYREKIAKFAEISRATTDDILNLKRVLYVARDETVFNILKTETEPYKSIFKVEKLTKFLEMEFG